MIEEVDLFITTGAEYFKFLYLNFNPKLKELIKRKVIPILYNAPKSKTDYKFFKNKIISSLSRSQIYTSRTQYELSKSLKIGKPIFLPVGIDVNFYLKKRSSHFMQWLINEEYLVMHGDELRDNFELLKLADLLKIGIVRISQYPEKDIYKNSIFSLSKDFKNIPYIYHLQNIDFNEYICILKNAKLYAGLVNSTNQPAGWTALCEAKVLNLPIIISKGLITKDFQKIFNYKNSQNFLEITKVLLDQDKILDFAKNLTLNKKLKVDSNKFCYSKTSEIFENFFNPNL